MPAAPSELGSLAMQLSSCLIVVPSILVPWCACFCAFTRLYVTAFSLRSCRCLVPEYRRPLVLQELLGYRADVAALQEVDDRMFSLCLTPALGEAGYDGVYTNKAGKVREGGAVFWRRERYSLAARRDVALKSLFPAEAG